MPKFILCVKAIVAMWMFGFAVSKLWGWFVVPQFGLAAMNIATALGLAFLYELVTFKSETFELSMAEIKTQIENTLFCSTTVLGIGFLIKLMS